jgi:C-terminal processing protease CtpA/Prc
MRRNPAIASLPLLALLAGCPPGDDPCAPEREKPAVVELFRSWYLWPELLPPQIDPAAYATTADLVAALTAEARALGQDRGWSYLTTAAASQAFYEEGTSVGFGIGLLQRGQQMLVSQVFPGSAAAAAGFARGDELLAVGETAGTLVDVPTLLGAGTFGAALGPATAGVTRVLQVRTLAGATEVRTVTKRTYALDPVPDWTVVPRDGLPPAGYVALRTFIGPADALLAEAFAAFEAQGVGDVVVDLRYNGGGLISTAQHLANLLGGGLSGSVMFDVRNNALHPELDARVLFGPTEGAVAPFRVAFVTTGASASASELVPNVLEAHRHAEVGLVGAKTYGKPVGQRGFGFQGCETVVYLVSLRLVNAEGDGDYFDGLPDAAGDFSGPLCAAEDDLGRAQSDPAEASTSAALQWLATGTCPAPAAAKGGAAALPSRAAPEADAYPEAPEPSVAQRHVRGLF